MSPDFIQIGATILFGVAVAHTFSVKFFERLAARHSALSGVWHLLGEVEIVFGFWAMLLVIFLALASGEDHALAYVGSLNFTEPMFVFAIMVMAASRPVLNVALTLVDSLARLLPMRTPLAGYLLILSLVPILGSFITEPAAMTLAAMLLRDRFYQHGLSTRLQYATLGVLFVNVSIGGTLTPYAAPPILMVAGTWGWDLAFMFEHFGWRSIVAVLINAGAVTALFHRQLRTLPEQHAGDAHKPVPPALTLTTLALLVGVVVFAHHPVVFTGFFLLFLGIASAYSHHHDRLIVREGLLVGFFLAGLVVLGGQQQWWLTPLLKGMSPTLAYYGTTALTAITDNAALTYLGSLVPDLSEPFKYALVAGAVTGGGLTVIANAPNPAGYSILKRHFANAEISPGGLLLSALLPTLVAVAAFRWI